MKKTDPILVDMDMILVDMIKVWIKRYNDITGESVREQDIKEYELRKYVKTPDILDKILSEKDFFLNMPPISGSTKCVSDLIDDDFDIVVVTQLPRRSNHWASKNKREWLEHYIPNFDLSNLIFAHRKEIVGGSVLIDDAPHHLIHWKKRHPKGLTVTINYKYNKDTLVDLRVNKSNGWRDIYGYLKKNG